MTEVSDVSDETTTDWHSDVGMAEKIHAEAEAAFFDATSRYEAACMTPSGPGAEAQANYDRAAQTYSDSLQALTRARKAQLPPFDMLLADPVMQVDPEARILASILQYAAAQPASAAAPASARSLYAELDAPLARVRHWALAPHGGSATGSRATAGPLRVAR